MFDSVICGLAVGEYVSAVTTLKVTEYLLIDDVTDFGSGHGARCATDHASKDRARDASEKHADRAADNADSSSGLSTG